MKKSSRQVKFFAFFALLRKIVIANPLRFAEKNLVFASLSLRIFFRKKFRFRNRLLVEIWIPGQREENEQIQKHRDSSVQLADFESISRRCIDLSAAFSVLWRFEDRARLRSSRKMKQLFPVQI